MGVISVTRTRPDNQKQIRFKLNMYSANCVAAIIYEYKEKDEETGKVHNMYQFFGFWNDLDHLKRCLGLMKSYDGTCTNLYNGTEDWDNWTKLKLNTYYPEMIKVAALFAKAGHKVELYYKEPKGGK